MEQKTSLSPQITHDEQESFSPFRPNDMPPVSLFEPNTRNLYFRQTTMRDIALTLNVSLMTVSLALKNSPRISKKRRKQVQETATRLGYRPNKFAQALIKMRHQDRHLDSCGTSEEKPSRSTTLRDIANEVKLSIMTVSMALRDNPRISKKRRQQVQETAAKLNYCPNKIAQALSKRRRPRHTSSSFTNENKVSIFVPDLEQNEYRLQQSSQA